MVPRVRPAPVHGRGEGGALRHAGDGRRLRDEEAALDLEGGIQQRPDGGDRHAPLRRERDVVPARDGARRQQPGLGVDELDHDLLEVQRPGDAVAHLLEHLVDRARLGQARGDLQQLLERVAVARGLDGLLRALQGAGGERHHGHEQVELVVGRAHAGDRLADRDDAQQVPVGVPAGHEELVAGSPGVGGLGSRVVGHVARAQSGVRPVDAALRDEVRAAALEALLERQRPHRPLVGLAQQRLAHRLAAVDGADDEVVPRRAVEVEGHALEAQRLGDRAGDLGQHGVEAPVGAHETGDVEQSLHALQGDQLVDLCPVRAHSSQSSARHDRR